jgi:hypothetical protein
MLKIKQNVFFVLLLVTLFTFLQAHAQEQNLCTQTLKKALKTYDDGRISAVPAMLDSCLKDGFTRAEKLQAYRLLVLSYIFQDEDEKAEESLLLLLKEDPEYKVNEVLDPAEFVNLYKTYRTLPFISIGIVGGVNQSRIKLLNEFSTDNVNSSPVKYKPGIGFQFGLVADILLYRNFQVNTTFLYSGKKYETSSDKMFGYTSLKLVESQSWLELPVVLKYNFGKNKLKFFAEAGMSGNLFLSSKADVTRISIANDNDASGPSVAMSNLRNKLNYAAVFGGGARYKLGYGYLMLDIRYSMGMRNVVNAKNRYSDNELIYYYGFIDSNYKLNNISVSFGYLKSLYKPKKIKSRNE